MIQIKNPSDEQFGYEYEFKLNGINGKGFLTYDLINEPEKRTLLLTTKQNIIPENINKDFEALKSQILLYSKNKGSIGIAKTIVNSIYNNDIKIENVKIAVHKFGPVPVLILPETFDLTFNGINRKCNIAVYPVIAGIKASQTKPLGVNSDLEFLSSLQVRLDVMFKRYLEDVAEYFFDIENHSGLIETFKNAKDAENVLGASILTKLEKIISPTKGKNFVLISNLKLAIENKYGDVVFKTKYARLFALYFINELYDFVGIKTKDYLEEFRQLRNATNEFSKYFDQDGDLAILKTTLQKYFNSKGISSIEDLDCITNELWVRRFVDFAKFVSNLKISKDQITFKPKIFLSHQYSIQALEILRKGLIDTQHKELENKIEFLFARDRKTGSPFEEFIKSKIWNSDSTFTIISKNKSGIDQKEIQYNWIAKEAVHSVLLKNDLTFLIEKEASDDIINELTEKIKKLDEYLSPDARNLDYKKAKVIEILKKRLNIYFTQNDTETLDDNLKKIILEEIKVLIEKKATKVLDAWLKLFTYENAAIIKKANKVLKYPLRIREAATKVLGSNNDKAVNELRSIIKKIKARKIVIHGKEYSLLRVSGNANIKVYKENVSNIIEALVGKGSSYQNVLDAFYSDSTDLN